jgi:hypothetical protein
MSVPDHGVRSRKEEALVTVGHPPDQERRFVFLAPDLDDLGFLVGLTDVMRPDDQDVPSACTHCTSFFSLSRPDLARR